MLAAELFIITLAQATTYTLLFPMQHPRLRTLVCLGFAFLTAIPVHFDTRFLIVTTVFSLFLAIKCVSITSAISAVIACILSVHMMLVPHSTDILYLQERYADTFTYIQDHTYFAQKLGSAVTVSRIYGDTYQSELYSDVYIETVANSLPFGVEVLSAYVEPVQSFFVYPSCKAYADAKHPVVHLVVSNPSGADIDTSKLPYTTILE